MNDSAGRRRHVGHGLLLLHKVDGRTRYPSLHRTVSAEEELEDSTMATTLIFGGSGKVARHITRLLSKEGQTVYSIIVSRPLFEHPSVSSSTKLNRLRASFCMALNRTAFAKVACS